MLYEVITRISGAEIFQDKKSHFLVFHDRITDRTAGRQPVGTILITQVGPENPRGIRKHDAVLQIDMLLTLGDGRLISDFGNGTAGQGIDQRRLAHIGNSHDHHPQGLARNPSVGSQGAAELLQTRNRGMFLGFQGNRLDRITSYNVCYTKLLRSVPSRIG